MSIDPKKYVDVDSEDTPIIIYKDKNVVVETLDIRPGLEAQSFEPSQDVDGFAPVTVSAVTSSIDSNIRSENIRQGVSILGVNGSIDALSGQTKTVNPTTSQQMVEPDDGYNGLTSVTVTAVNSSIDSNIAAENIKSGVSILGVSGSVEALNGESLSVTPSTSAQTILPESPKNAFTSVSVSAVTSAIDSDIQAGNIKRGVNILGVSGTVDELVGQERTITPSTAQQVITPNDGATGITKVTVTAVNASIDSNIQAGNIVSGVTILGVTGSATDLNPESLSVTPTTSSQTFRPTSPKNAFDEVTVGAVTSSIDANITAGNIKSGVSILGVNGSVTELNGTTTSLTPTTSSQTVTPTSPYNGFTSVTVGAVDSSIDSNIQAGNIKSGVRILGVDGTYTGVAPSGTLNITENGTYDVSSYANADVSLPTSTFGIANTAWLGAVDSDGVISSRSTGGTPDFSGITVIDSYFLAYRFTNNTHVTGGVDMGDLRTIGTYGCYRAFYTSGLNGGVDMSSVVTVAADGCAYMFYSYMMASSITSLDLRSLSNASGDSSFQGMCYGCSYLTTVNLSSLTTVSGDGACQYMFDLCTGLTSVDLSSLTTISGSNGCSSMFEDCTHLTSIDLSGLSSVTGWRCMGWMFLGCTSLTSLSFPSLTADSFGTYTNQFDNMLYGVTGCTVHFPAALSNVIGYWTSVTGGFGGTNTTVLFDL